MNIARTPGTMPVLTPDQLTEVLGEKDGAWAPGLWDQIQKL